MIKVFGNTLNHKQLDYEKYSLKFEFEVHNFQYLRKYFDLDRLEVQNSAPDVGILADETMTEKIGTTYLYLSALKNFWLLITIFAAIFMA